MGKERKDHQKKRQSAPTKRKDEIDWEKSKSKLRNRKSAMIPSCGRDVTLNESADRASSRGTLSGRIRKGLTSPISKEVKQLRSASAFFEKSAVEESLYHPDEQVESASAGSDQATTIPDD